MRTQMTEEEIVTNAAMVFGEMGMDRDTVYEIVGLIQDAKSPQEKAAIIRAVSDGGNDELERMAADLESGNVDRDAPKMADYLAFDPRTGRPGRLYAGPAAAKPKAANPPQGAR